MNDEDLFNQIPVIKSVTVFYREEDDESGAIEIDFGSMSPYEALGLLVTATKLLRKSLTSCWEESVEDEE